MQKETHLARAGNALLNGALWMISVRAIDRALVLVLGFSLWRLFNLPFHLICLMVFFAGFTWRLSRRSGFACFCVYQSGIACCISIRSQIQNRRLLLEIRHNPLIRPVLSGWRKICFSTESDWSCPKKRMRKTR